MEAKHTPGPWFNNPDWQEDDGEAGAIIRQNSPDEIICPEVWGQDMNQRDANARLIAAAPDLLAVLENIRGDCLSALDGTWDCSDDGFEAILTAVETVIAKAKGR